MKFQKQHLLLYAVTDRHWTGERTLYEQVEEALLGGATMVQLREKDLSEEEFEKEARQILDLCHRFEVPMLINDNVLLAARIGADGVHAGQSDMDPIKARQILGEDKIVGVTARTPGQAIAAQEAGADYLGSGAVFGTFTKGDASRMSYGMLRQITRSVSIPVAAIGGVKSSNIDRLSGLGVQGVAVVSGIFGAQDIRSETELLKKKARRLLEDQALLSAIRKKGPIVQCITNLVTANDCANALLAIGASPTMAHHPGEMEDFSKIIDGLVLNLGAAESFEAMGLAADLARKRGGVPVVIDPVGTAVSSLRRQKCLELIRLGRPLCIRGNAAEIRALALGRMDGGGVDDIRPFREEETVKDALLLSRRSGAIVAATGAVDILAFQGKVIRVEGGTALFKKLTGAGCMLSAMMGAFMAASPSLDGAAAACRFLAACGERAMENVEESLGGMGSFHVALMDELS